MNTISTAFNISVADLVARGSEHIPEPFIPACHLIYSSPATLAYNSPGAVGFGVKRAGLVIPESVMLLISPSACGRNSSILSAEEGYADRMFYLCMDETDLVTGRHLTEIPQAIRDIVDICSPKPKVVVLCITCVDALLGTDLERVCRKAEQETDVRVVPSYMYALTREGKKPPMVAIRDTIYSLVERREVRPDTINLMGFFSPLDRSSEIFKLFPEAGIRHLQEVSRCRTLEEYADLGAANFNLVLHPESQFAADQLYARTGMPYIEMTRIYDPERMHRQYRLFGSAVGITIKDNDYYEQAMETRQKFMDAHKGTRFAVGEMTNANAYELAATLCEMGMEVPYIFSNLTAYDFPFLRRLAKVSPETKVYTGIEPSMVHYKEVQGVDLAIGKDAGQYCPSVPAVEWNSEQQPFGYQAFCGLLHELEEALS